MASQSHQEVYPVDRGFFHWKDGCEKECLEAQMNKHYDKLDCEAALDAKKIGKQTDTSTAPLPQK
jgi:hypothetical protein